MSETIDVTAADGHRFALTLHAALDARAPAIMICPAMGTPARVYTPLAEAFAAQGFHVAVLELRGLGGSSLRAGRGTDYGYRTMVEQDWTAARAVLSQRLPQAPLFLFGHSLGGQISFLSAAHDPQGVAGVIVVAGGSVHYRGWSGVQALGIFAFTQFAGVLAGLCGYFPGKRVGFGGTEAKTVMQDWARLGRNGRFELGGDSDYEAALARCPVPALGLSFQHDSFAPHGAQARLLGKLKSAKVTHLALSAKDTGMKLDHYNWIKNSEPVVSRVSQWIRTTGARA